MDLQAQTVTVYGADVPVQTFKESELIVDPLLPNLTLPVAALFPDS